MDSIRYKYNAYDMIMRGGYDSETLSNLMRPSPVHVLLHIDDHCVPLHLGAPDGTPDMPGRYLSDFATPAAPTPSMKHRGCFYPCPQVCGQVPEYPMGIPAPLICVSAGVSAPSISQAKSTGVAAGARFPPLHQRCNCILGSKLPTDDGCLGGGEKYQNISSISTRTKVDDGFLYSKRDVILKVIQMEALRMFLNVEEDGRVDFPPLYQFRGKQIEVVVLDSDEINNSLLLASETSLEFWDNAIDDKVWNNV